MSAWSSRATAGTWRTTVVGLGALLWLHGCGSDLPDSEDAGDAGPVGGDASIGGDGAGAADTAAEATGAEAGALCDGGACCVDRCAAGDSQCTGAGVVTCTAQATGCLDWSASASCGADAGCGSDGRCQCGPGAYACATGCCPYAIEQAGGRCMYNLDVAALRDDVWSYVTFAAAAETSNPDLTDVTVVLGGKEGGAITSKSLYTDVLGRFEVPNYHVAVGIDAAEQAHVVYYAKAQLTYVRPDGTHEVLAGWDGNSSPRGGVCPGATGPTGPVDLAVDRATGTVHVAWPAVADVNTSTTTQSFILHAQRAASGWTMCDVVAQAGPVTFENSPVAITLDASGAPIVAYGRGANPAGAPRHIEVSRLSAGVWSATDATPQDDGGIGATHVPSVAVGVEPSGAPWVAFDREILGGPVTVGVATAFLGPPPSSDAVEWTAQTGTYAPLARAVAALSVGPSPHTLLVLDPSGLGSWSLDDAVRTPGGWHGDRVASAVSRAAATTDTANGLHAVYCDVSALMLFHVRR